jgi:hypothetical protein
MRRFALVVLTKDGKLSNVHDIQIGGYEGMKRGVIAHAGIN